MMTTEGFFYRVREEKQTGLMMYERGLVKSANLGYEIKLDYACK